VSVKKSVTDDFIICLEDGKKLRTLKRYLGTHYDLSPEEYRRKWGLPADYPMTARVCARTFGLREEDRLGRMDQPKRKKAPDLVARQERRAS